MALLGLVLPGCQGSIAPVTPTALAPHFQLATLTGESISLSELRGRWVVINFWATWCIPCREEMPYLQMLADQHADQLTVLAVNLREPASTIQPFVDELGLRLPILVLPDDQTLLAYGVRGLPLTVVVAPDGSLVLRQVGPLTPPSFDRWLMRTLDRANTPPAP